MRDLDPIFLDERIKKLEEGGGGSIEHLEEAIESIDNSLIADVEGTDEHFHFDNKNGIYGFNTDEERGEETFTPFGVNCEMLYSADTVEANIELSASINDFKMILLQTYYIEQNHKVWTTNTYCANTLSINDCIGFTSNSKYLWYTITDMEHLTRFVTDNTYKGIRIIGIK